MFRRRRMPGRPESVAAERCIGLWIRSVRPGADGCQKLFLSPKKLLNERASGPEKRDGALGVPLALGRLIAVGGVRDVPAQEGNPFAERCCGG